MNIFYEIPMLILAGFCAVIDRLDFKLDIEMQRTQNSQNILKKRENVGSLHLPNYKSDHKARVI